MLYTRKGDNGTSGLYGTKDRRPKDDVIYETLGTLDELNSLLGLCFVHSAHSDETIARAVRSAQQSLFIIQAQIAGADHHIEQSHVESLEKTIAELEEQIVNPHSFIVPGSNALSAWFDYARAVSRRAERAAVRASRATELSPEILRYLNRMSSLLYALARFSAVITNAKEIAPSYDVRG